MKLPTFVVLTLAPLLALAQGGPSVNENTGDLGYVYPFNLSPARGRHQPALALTYSSASRANRGFGYGWDLTDSYVEVDARVAPEVDYGTSPIFTLVRGQERDVLVQFAPGYSTEFQREPLAIARTSSAWTVTDAQGTVSTFDFVCGNRWYLSTVLDLDGNRVVYRHDCAKGLTEILYDLMGDALAPDTVYAHQVELQYEPTTSAGIENVAGLLVDHQARLKKVVVRGPSRKIIRSTELTYTPTTTAEALWKLTERGFQEAQSLPPTEFSYSSAGDLELGAAINAPVQLPLDAAIDKYDWTDLDGDGLADLRIGLYWRRTELSAGQVQFGALQPIVPDYYGYATASGEFNDFDGDGVIDLLHTGTPGNCVGKLKVHFGRRSSSGLTFDETACIDLSAVMAITPPTNGLPPLPRKDVNGDGVLDYIVHVSGTVSDVAVFFSKKTATGWRLVRWGVNYADLPGLSDIPAGGKPYDANGDGFPDVVPERGQSATTQGNSDLQTYRALIAGVTTPDVVYLSSWPNGWVHQTSRSFGTADLPPRQRSAQPTNFGYLWTDSPDHFPATGRCTTRFTDPTKSYFATLDVNGDGIPDFFQNGVWGDESGYPVPVPGTFEWRLRVSLGTVRGVLASGEVKACDVPPCTSTNVTLQAAMGEGNQNPRWRSPYVLTAPGVIFGGNDSKDNYECWYDADPFDTGQEKARLADLDGDGVLDYVHVSLGSQPTVRKGLLGDVEVARPVLLRSVKSPSGLQTSFAYASSRKFGDKGSTRPVVVTGTTTGANVETQVTRYWYAAGTDVKIALGYDLGRRDDLGFGTSYSWTDGTSLRWARKTTWNTGSYARKGRPSEVSEGPVTSAAGVSPPTFTISKSTATLYGVKSASLTSCSDAASYPIQVFATSTDTRSYLDAVYGGRAVAGALSEVSCADVDSVGRVLRAQNRTYIEDPSGMRYYSGILETTLTRSGGTPSACMLVDRKMTVVQRDFSANLVLSRDSAEYNDHCQKTAEYGELDDGQRRKLKTWTYKPLGSGTAAWFGLPVSTTAVGVTTAFDYGPATAVPYLYIWSETTSDGGTKSLRTLRDFHTETGWKLSETGPVVLLNGTPSGTIPQITRYYLFDGLGRTLAIAKQPFSGSAGAANRIPSATMANQVVEAHAYDDTSSPRWSQSYRFAMPRSYAIAASDGAQAIPITDDVMLAISYLDEAGREIQVRERLGTGTAGPEGDTAAGGFVRSSPSLTGWKVTKSVWFDDAGRAAVSWEPHAVVSGTFASPKNGAESATRATVTAFDSQGRPWCTATQYVANGKPTAPTACISDSSHTASFKMATETRYQARQISGRGPYGGWFMETINVPPDLNVVGRTGSVSALLGPSGEALGNIDADGRRTWVEHDLLGREIASWREGGSPSVATPNPGSAWGQVRTTGSPQAASWIHYDRAGLPYETWEANAPSVVRQVRYDEYGRISVVFPNVSRPSEFIAYTYGELGRVTRIDEVTATGTRSSWNKYDEPYAGQGAAPPSEYGFTAGKITSTGVDRGGQSETTIAYGFDDAGRLTRRDQWFLKLEGWARRFTVSSTYGGDGRVLDSMVRNPYAPGDSDSNPYFQYQVHFDSAGRPVEILGKSQAWSAAPTFESMYTAAGYDALDRPAVMKADVGRAVSARMYDDFSGRLRAECKRREAGITCLGSAINSALDIYRTDTAAGATYEGTKLKTFVEMIGSTSTYTAYTNTYLPSGRVSSTQAGAMGTAQPQTQSYTEAFTYNGVGNIATVATTRNTGIAGRTAVNRNETYNPVPSPNQSGTILDQVKTVADTGTVQQKSKVDVRYGFDLANRLVSVTRSAGESEVLDYGPDGELLRRRVTSGSTSKDVFYFGEYATVTASGCTTNCTATAAVNSVAVDAHVIYAGTRIASARAMSPDGATAERTLYYYRTRLGSVIGTSRRGGAAGAYYRYTPYGEVDRTNETDTTRSELGYTNALRLSGGLIHLVNRAYDTEVRMFVQADVVDRLRYAYTGGDPINRSDPTGLRWQDVFTDVLNKNPSTNSTTEIFLGIEPGQLGGSGSESKTAKPPTKPPTAGTEPARAEDQATGLAQNSDANEKKSEPAETAYRSDDETLSPELRAAEQYLSGSEKGRAALEGLRNLGGVKVRRPTKQDEEAHGSIWYDGEHNEIVWDPRAAVRFDKDSGRQSPAMGLLHEGVHHLLRYNPDDKDRRDRERGLHDPEGNFPNLHERTVVREWETPVARDLGEQARTNGRSPGWVTTTCVSCTVDRKP